MRPKPWLAAVLHIAKNYSLMYHDSYGHTFRNLLSLSLEVSFFCTNSPPPHTHMSLQEVETNEIVRADIICISIRRHRPRVDTPPCTSRTAVRVKPAITSPCVLNLISTVNSHVGVLQDLKSGEHGVCFLLKPKDKQGHLQYLACGVATANYLSVAGGLHVEMEKDRQRRHLCLCFEDILNQNSNNTVMSRERACSPGRQQNKASGKIMADRGELHRDQGGKYRRSIGAS